MEEIPMTEDEKLTPPPMPGAQPEEGDPVGEAVAAAEEAEAAGPIQMQGDFLFEDGQTLKILVPADFTPQHFEIAVGILVQMRVAAEQRKAALRPIVPIVQGIVGTDGRRLT
jgi:hypothetical protein